MQECQEDKSGIKQLVKGSCQDRESISAACPFQGSRQNGAKQERVIVISKSLAAFVFVMAQKSSKDIPANLFLLFQEENIAWAVPSSHNFRALAVRAKSANCFNFLSAFRTKTFSFLERKFWFTSSLQILSRSSPGPVLLLEYPHIFIFLLYLGPLRISVFVTVGATLAK